ncbi:flavoprotein [Caldifermentibacillus hisashii]|uniref:flavoprotein n=1 Tax=Caldifermentibacillus hisashii TaxID=996558 RepID=UPI0034D40DBC
MGKINILVIASGSIGVIHLPQYIMTILSKGLNCKCILTEQATNFVSPSAISNFVDTFTDLKDYSRQKLRTPHIELGQWASIIIILPATANMIGKIANGIADNLATTTILSTDAPIYVYPNMAKTMAKKKIVVRNIQIIKELGYKVFDEYSTSFSVSKQKTEDSYSLPSIPNFSEQLDELILHFKGGENNE